MVARLGRARHDEEGIALVMAIALMGIAGVLMVTLVGITVREGRQTANNRDRAAAVTTAEGAVDATLAAIQAVDVAALPCGGTSTNQQSIPDVLTVTTTVTYLDATGAALSCPPAADVLASQVLVKALASSTPAGGGQTVNRTFETLASLKPKYSTDLNKAIFGNAGITVGNNFDLYGSSGPNADVYTNGDFSCTNNEHFRGSIVAPNGSITLSNTCLIDVGVYAKNAVTMSNGTVSGDVKVSAGPANISGGTVAGRVYAASSSTYCTNNPAKCTIGAVRIPKQETFPTLNGDQSVIDQYVAKGWAVLNLTNCDSSKTGSPGKWLEDSADAITQPTVIRTPCRLSFQNNAKTVSLKNDVAIFADRGVDISNTVSFKSTVTGTKHEILFIHPADFATRVSETCSSLGTGITLVNQVDMTPDIKELLYSPCNISKANQSTIYGQVYSGGTATISNKTDAYYVPVSVIGVTSSAIVEYYDADVLYKRENVG